MVYKPDNVNNPEHYKQGTVECIEAIESSLTPEEYRGFLKGNIIKYIWRERKKSGLESCQKAEWYMKRLVEFTESNNLKNHANRVNIWGDSFPREEMPNPQFKEQKPHIPKWLQKGENEIGAARHIGDIGDSYSSTDGMYHHLKLQETQN